MIGFKHTGRVLALVVLVLVLVAVVIVMVIVRSSDDDQDRPDDSPPIAEWTPGPGEGPGPVNLTQAAQIDPTDTPFVPPAEPVFQDAVELARADLSIRLNVVPDRLKALESDSALFRDKPVECPALADEFQDVYYVYLQYERFIYPYQAYQSEETGTVVEACADVQVDQAVLYVPTPDVRATLLDIIRADLTARGVDAARGQFQTVRPVTWTDTALGCRVGLDEAVTSTIIEGYLIVYVVSGVSYEYHTDATGEQVHYCEPPAGYETVAAFMEALQVDEYLEMVIIEGETAIYNGLNVKGTLIELGDYASLVGVFEFDTNTAARGAAQRIDDAGVSHIFVSGNVLVVQEENDPIVYGILLNFAEEVRTPLLEEEAPPDEGVDEYGAGVEFEATLPPTPGE